MYYDNTLFATLHLTTHQQPAFSCLNIKADTIYIDEKESKQTSIRHIGKEDMYRIYITITTDKVTSI